MGGPGRQGGRFVTVFALAQHSGDAAVFRIGFIERRDQRSVIGKILVELALYPVSFYMQRKYVFPPQSEEIGPEV